MKLIIAMAIVLGLCAINASLGDSVAEQQAAADHKAETLSAMRSKAKLQRLEKQAHTMLALDNLK